MFALMSAVQQSLIHALFKQMKLSLAIELQLVAISMCICCSLPRTLGLVVLELVVLLQPAMQMMASTLAVLVETATEARASPTTMVVAV